MASVIGRDFAFRLLKSIMEIGDELRSQMTNLVGLEILYEKALYPELEYIFKHGLIQEVAYNNLVKQRRREIHGSIARAIEEQYSDRLENHYESLAHHYELTGNVEKAVQYLILAGEKSNQIRGAQAGFDFLKRASQISETAKLALDAQTEVRLLIELASAQQAVGSIGDAVKGFSKCIEPSRRHALVDYEKEGLRNLLDRMPVDPGKGLAKVDQRALLKRGGEAIQKKRIVFHLGSGGKGKNHPPEFWRD